MFGWLANGKFFECDQFEHLDLVKKTKALRSVLTKAVEIDLVAIEEAYRYCKGLDDRGEHGEWHVYEWAGDNLDKSRVWRDLLNAGFLRVGKLGGTLHFEGRPQAIQSRMHDCVDLALDADCDYVFEPQPGKKPHA